MGAPPYGSLQSSRLFPDDRKTSRVVMYSVKSMIKYEEIMTNDDNLESNLLTSSLLKTSGLHANTSWTEENVLGDLTLQVNYAVGRLKSIVLAKWFKSIGYHSLHRSVMGYSLTVTGTGMTGWECEC